MYEPVQDSCVTILKPNFVMQNSYEQQSDIDIEDLSKTDHSEEQQQQQQQQQQEQPPDKPPRRNRLRKLENSFKMRQNSNDNCIDIDHINLESERNYKNKYITISVQTSPIVPYRLRIFPKMCSMDEKENSQNKLKTCCRIISQIFLSQIGLTITLILWALLGAAGFYSTEGYYFFLLSNHPMFHNSYISIMLTGLNKNEVTYLYFLYRELLYKK